MEVISSFWQKMSLLLFLLVSAACFLPLSVQSTDITYCTKKAYSVKVNDVVITPYPVETGKPTTFTIKASTDEALSGGKMVLAVSYFGIKVHGETDNICEKTSCPVSAGEFELSHTQTLPSITPPGLYTLKLRIKDEKNHELSCISFKFTIGFGVYDESM